MRWMRKMWRKFEGIRQTGGKCEGSGKEIWGGKKSRNGNVKEINQGMWRKAVREMAGKCGRQYVEIKKWKGKKQDKCEGNEGMRQMWKKEVWTECDGKIRGKWWKHERNVREMIRECEKMRGNYKEDVRENRFSEVLVPEQMCKALPWPCRLGAAPHKQALSVPSISVFQKAISSVPGRDWTSGLRAVGFCTQPMFSKESRCTHTSQGKLNWHGPCR